MTEIFSAIRRAFVALFYPRVWLIVLVPFVLAILVWGIAAYLFWGDVVDYLSRLAGVGSEPWTVGGFDVSWLKQVIGGAISLITSAAWLLAVLATVMLQIGIFAVPYLLKVVSERDFPDLEQLRGGSDLGSALNSIGAFVLFIPMWLATIPLWFVPLAGPIVSWLLFGWLNRRMFGYDVLAVHASEEERVGLLKRHASRLYGLALTVALFQFVPFLNLLGPIVSALAFIYFLLDRLAAQRSAALVPLVEVRT